MATLAAIGRGNGLGGADVALETAVGKGAGLASGADMVVDGVPEGGGAVSAVGVTGISLQAAKITNQSTAENGATLSNVPMRTR